MKKISVIIPTYKSVRYLPRCLDSILKQNGQEDLEIIVVDDASPDNGATREIIKTYETKYKNIKPVFLEKNCGPSGARNAGVSVATGEYLCFIDDDDRIGFNPEYYDKNYFSKMLKSSKQSPDIIVCDRVAFDHGRYFPLGFYSDFKPGSSWENSKKIDALEYMAGFLYRKEFICTNKIKFSSDVKWFEDSLFSFISGYLAKSIAACKEACYIYHKRPDSLDHAISEFKRAEKNRNYLALSRLLLLRMMIKNKDYLGIPAMVRDTKYCILSFNQYAEYRLESGPDEDNEELVLDPDSVLPCKTFCGESKCSGDNCLPAHQKTSFLRIVEDRLAAIMPNYKECVK